jgi:hypothetical protein
MPTCESCGKKPNIIYETPRGELCAECNNYLQDVSKIKPLSLTHKNLIWIFIISAVFVAMLWHIE